MDDSSRPSWPPPQEVVRCPYAWFDAMRASAPVAKVDTGDGVPLFLITGWKAAAAILSDDKRFRNSVPDLREDADLEPWPLPEIPRLYEFPSIFFADGKDHSIKRSWALKFVTPEKIQQYRPIVADYAQTLVAAFVRHGECDFMEEYTEILPMLIVRSLMGLPESADPMIKRLSAAIPLVDNNPDATDEQKREMAEASAALVGLCADEILKRASSAKDDFLSELVAAQIDRDGELDPNTLAKHAMVMIFGADHAMGAHIAQLVAHIARDRKLQAALRADRRLIRFAAAEALRLDNPVPWLYRYANETVTVEGVTIPQGSRVLVATSAANYDQAMFASPETFDLARDNLSRDHLSLGRGKHRCVGSPMAMLQVEATIDALLDQTAWFDIDERKSDLSPHYSLGFRVPRGVHLRLEPRKERASA